MGEEEKKELASSGCWLHLGHCRLGDAGGGVERTYEITNVAINGMTKSHEEVVEGG